MKSRLVVAGATILLAACGDGSGPGSVRSVDVSSAITTVQVGEAAQFTATARDANGSVVSGARVTWSSTPANVASVTATGLVSGLLAGQATIRATVSGVSGSLPFTVNPNPSGTVRVSMPGDIFAPDSADINVGGAVIFEFPARAHNVIFANVAGAPTDIQVISNQNIPRIFTVAGVFRYDCTLHPPMAGVVRVR
jgi:plastocyanin